LEQPEQPDYPEDRACQALPGLQLWERQVLLARLDFQALLVHLADREHREQQGHQELRATQVRTSYSFSTQ